MTTAKPPTKAPDDRFVEITSLEVRYGRVQAVRGLSLTVPRGSVYGLIGPNGAGKTSTMRVLATLLAPHRGRAAVAGWDVAREPAAVRALIGWVPDAFGAWDDLTVAEYLHFFAAAYAIPQARRPALVHDVLALTDLGDREHHPVAGLSRGMQQRLAISRVLLHDPELLILDEPASGLDPRARIEMRELLRELARMGKTILISSHILHELAQLCDRVAIIERGAVVAAGTLGELFRQLRLARTVHVQATEQDDAVQARIRALPGVDGVDLAGDRLAVRLREGEVAVEDLHAALVGLGLRLRMFQPEALDMETAFMKLTTGAAAPAAG